MLYLIYATAVVFSVAVALGFIVVGGVLLVRQFGLQGRWHKCYPRETYQRVMVMIILSAFSVLVLLIGLGVSVLVGVFSFVAYVALILAVYRRGSTEAARGH